MNLEIINRGKGRVPRRFLYWWAHELSTILQRKRVRGFKNTQLLYLVFLSKTEAKKLNFKFRGKNYATDVLSFSPIEDNCLGELVFCPEILAAQAKAHGLSQRHELGYMMIHRVLHLLGYEHEKGGAQAKKMYKLQDLVFAQLRGRHVPADRNQRGSKKTNRS